MRMIFRDHVLSDLIGFVYSGMGAARAAQDFLTASTKTAGALLASGRDALVPIILDGENAWEYYDRNGRPFFRELYGRIQADPRMEAITVREAFKRIAPEPLDAHLPRLVDQRQLRRLDRRGGRQQVLAAAARRPQGSGRTAQNVREDEGRRAREEMLIAEGSDWNWWYGPEHETANADRVRPDLPRTSGQRLPGAGHRRRRPSFRCRF